MQGLKYYLDFVLKKKNWKLLKAMAARRENHWWLEEALLAAADYLEEFCIFTVLLLKEVEDPK